MLGAIDPAERTQVDEHLATCPDCREELASLAGLPALLRRVPTAEAERLAVADPADLLTEETAARRSAAVRAGTDGAGAPGPPVA